MQESTQHTVDQAPATDLEAQETFGLYADEVDPEDFEPQPLSPQSRRRVLAGIAVVVTLGLMAVLPPLINVNRYQRRIVTSISASLGRPVHLDSVSLNLLPMPGFTLTNFVVAEDPAFGSEPVIRANTVTATLRMRSLWRRQVEFSKISLDDPSVNLVQRADGQWNVESILLQASHMPVVPTEQKTPSNTQRFPYIEATGARVNLKQGLEKQPFSLLDAKFALWLAEPEMWRLRLEAHPTRTDNAPADAGVFRLDGTLGKADSLQDVPVDLRAEWNAAPLGAASILLSGRDAGIRGDMTLLARIKGTAGTNEVVTRLQFLHLRRSEFVPSRTLDIEANCNAHAGNLFHQFTAIRCVWPPEASQTGLGSLVVNGDLPDLHHPESAAIEARWTNVPVTSAIDLLREASPRVSSELEGSGIITGALTCCDGKTVLSPTGAFTVQHSRLAFDGKPLRPVEDPEILGELNGAKITLEPIELSLGGTQPAVLSLQTDDSGSRMHLTGTALRSRLLAFGLALPQFGDGLEAALPDVPRPAPTAKGLEPVKTAETPIKLDLVSYRAWTGAQTWSPAPHAAPLRKPRRR